MTILQNRKVSVIIPNYNYAKYLKKRIWSVVGQTYPIYELIILDDKSTDDSARVIEGEIEKVKVKFPELKLKFVKNEKNTGKAIAQWKKGFELATGDFVWIAEADDLSSRYFLEEMMRAFDDSEVVIAYAESRIINGAGLMITPNFRWSRDKEKTGHYKKSYVKNGAQEIEEIMAIRCTIPNVSAVVFRNDKNVPYGKYLEEALQFKQVGDWHFYVKVLGYGKISYNRKSLNRFRVHGGSVTSNSKKADAHYKEVLAMHEMMQREYVISEKVLKNMAAEEKRIRDKYGIIEGNE